MTSFIKNLILPIHLNGLITERLQAYTSYLGLVVENVLLQSLQIIIVKRLYILFWFIFDCLGYGHRLESLSVSGEGLKLGLRSRGSQVVSHLELVRFPSEARPPAKPGAGLRSEGKHAGGCCSPAVPRPLRLRALVKQEERGGRSDPASSLDLLWPELLLVLSLELHETPRPGSLPPPPAGHSSLQTIEKVKIVLRAASLAGSSGQLHILIIVLGLGESVR